MPKKKEETDEHFKFPRHFFGGLFPTLDGKFLSLSFSLSRIFSLVNLSFVKQPELKGQKRADERQPSSVNNSSESNLH
jgi:hypothetical protein